MPSNYLYRTDNQPIHRNLKPPISHKINCFKNASAYANFYYFVCYIRWNFLRKWSNFGKMLLLVLSATHIALSKLILGDSPPHYQWQMTCIWWSSWCHCHLGLGRFGFFKFHWIRFSISSSGFSFFQRMVASLVVCTGSKHPGAHWRLSLWKTKMLVVGNCRWFTGVVSKTMTTFPRAPTQVVSWCSVTLLSTRKRLKTTSISLSATSSVSPVRLKTDLDPHQNRSFGLVLKPTQAFCHRIISYFIKWQTRLVFVSHNNTLIQFITLNEYQLIKKLKTSHTVLILTAHSKSTYKIVIKLSLTLVCIAIRALTLLVWRQEEQPACKNSVRRCWRGYLTTTRCKWFHMVIQLKKMNGIMKYQLKLKKDQQIASGSVKLLQHWKRWRGIKLQVCQR